MAYSLSFNSYYFGRFFVPGTQSITAAFFMCFEVYLGLLIDFVADDFMHLETVCDISSDLLWHVWQISFGKKYFVAVFIVLITVSDIGKFKVFRYHWGLLLFML